MIFIFKAKGKPVGTISHRAVGNYIKNAPNHWQLLKDTVKASNKKRGLSENSGGAKETHNAASSLVKFAKKLPNPLNEEQAHKFIEEKFSHLADHPHFNNWKKRVTKVAHDYFKSLHNMAIGEKAEGKESKTAKKTLSWKNQVKELFSASEDTDVHDAFLHQQFQKAGHSKMLGVLKSARAAAGKGETIPDTPQKHEGFKGMCKAILRKAYIMGPTAFTEAEVNRYEKAFKTASQRRTKGVSKPIALEKALALVESHNFYKENPKAFAYCCRRHAMMNGGLVNMAAIMPYMRNAINKYGDKFPSTTYDQPKVKVRKKA